MPASRADLPPPSPEVMQALGCMLDSRKPLGKGSFKSVFEARVLSTGQRVVVTSELMGSSAATHLSEQAVLERIRACPHPNLISSKAAPLEHKGRFYMVLERCEQELYELFEELVQEGGQLGESTAAKHFVQAADAVRHLHGLGVAHRDLKLENMLIASDGSLKIIDFGLAHCSTGSPDTPDAMLCDGDDGSLAYGAPEVRASHYTGCTYDARAADVWALGICLWLLSTGFWPLREATNKDWRFERLRRSQAKGESSVHAIHGWYQKKVSLSQDLVTLLDRMLQIDPAARPTLDEVLNFSWVREATTSFEGHLTFGSFDEAATSPCSQKTGVKPGVKPGVKVESDQKMKEASSSQAKDQWSPKAITSRLSVPRSSPPTATVAVSHVSIQLELLDGTDGAGFGGVVIGLVID